MELIPIVRSSHQLSLNNKTKICNILSRYPRNEHNSLVLEIIDALCAGEFELMNEEELRDLEYEVKELKSNYVDEYDIKSIAADVAEDVVRHYNTELRENIIEIADAHKNLVFFKEQSKKLQEYAEEININLKAINESILALVDFIDTRKSVNLRAESNKPEVLLDEIQKHLNRITPINLRKSE